MNYGSSISARLSLCLLAVSAASCASAPPPAPTSTMRPHQFHASRMLSVKNDGGVRPDYVVVRVTEGAPHSPGGRTQPVLETRFLVAASERATTFGVGDGATVVPRTSGPEGTLEFSTVVTDRVETGPEVWAVDLPKVDWPAGHDDAVEADGASGAGVALPAKFAAESGRPFDYRAEYGVDYVGGDGVALTFQLETRSEGAVVREVPATTIRLLYGQSVVFATRRPPADAR